MESVDQFTEEAVKKLIGKRLRAVRLSKGQTIAEFAKIAKMSEARLGSYERAEVPIKTEVGLGLCAQFDVNPLYLSFHERLMWGYLPQIEDYLDPSHQYFQDAMGALFADTKSYLRFLYFRCHVFMARAEEQLGRADKLIDLLRLFELSTDVEALAELELDISANLRAFNSVASDRFDPLKSLIIPFVEVIWKTIGRLEEELATAREAAIRAGNSAPK